MDELNRAAEYWSEQQGQEPRTRWWQSETIIRHNNYKICGQELEGWNAGALALMKEMWNVSYVEHAVSIGCGMGNKEIEMVRNNVAGHFICFDIAKGRIEAAKKKALEEGIADRIEFICGDFFSSEYRNRTYDMVFWDNSLHHMPDTFEVISVSWDILKDGGIFFCNDFIGNNRFQWTDMQMAIVNGIRLYLSEEYFVNQTTGGNLARFVNTPTMEQMMQTDPSEAADSENILPAVNKICREPLIINLGGLIYQVCLEDILQNMPEGSPILDYMLKLDGETIKFGLSLYALILARK